MRSSHLRVILVLCIAVLALSVTGCQTIADKAAEEVIEQSTGVEVDKSGEDVTIKGEDGTEITASTGGELPEGFPEDVPVYEGEIVNTIKADKGYSVIVATTDDVQTITDWYKAELEKEGWEIKTEMTVEGGGVFTAEKGTSQLQVTIGADTSGDKTSVSLYVTTE